MIDRPGQVLDLNLLDSGAQTGPFVLQNVVSVMPICWIC